MNRIKRDYCSKGRHPHWRAWRYCYKGFTHPLQSDGLLAGYAPAQKASQVRLARRFYELKKIGLWNKSIWVA